MVTRIKTQGVTENKKQHPLTAACLSVCVPAYGSVPLPLFFFFFLGGGYSLIIFTLKIGRSLCHYLHIKTRGECCNRKELGCCLITKSYLSTPGQGCCEESSDHDGSMPLVSLPPRGAHWKVYSDGTVPLINYLSTLGMCCGMCSAFSMPADWIFIMCLYFNFPADYDITFYFRTVHSVTL